MMTIVTRLVSYHAVLAVVIFLQCSLLHAKEVFLVGEDTPVWLAECPDSSSSVSYTKLEQGMVKQALDYWKVMQTSGGFPVRRKRSVDDTNYSESYTSPELTVAEGKRFVSKRSTDIDNVYPSVLLVVDYDHFHPMSESNKQQVIKETILYALAFWRSVDTELQQHIQSPRVSLRITGIVITHDRKAAPYIKNTMLDSLQPMLEHWWAVAKTNPDFPTGSYDIVAHLTDAYHAKYRGRPRRTFPEPFPSNYGYIASSGSPCNLIGNIAGLIVYDDFAFMGIHAAVKKMTNIFGDDSISGNNRAFERKEWTPTSLTKISNGLKGSNGACMSAPKEHHSPGKPIIPVMAGELLPRAKQCEASGFGSDTWHCWNSKYLSTLQSSCEYMKCSMPHWYSSCTWSNPTLDGTFCNEDNTKICVAGQCVDKN